MTSIKGQLISGNKGFKSNNVDLYKITSIKSKNPKLIASTSSDRDGFFEFAETNISPKNIYYISAKNRSSILTGLLKSHTHQDLTINDRSTVASGIVFNPFIEGDHIRGSKSSRRSGWMTYRNLVLSSGKVAGLARKNKATSERLNLLANLNAAAIADPSTQRKLLELTAPKEGPAPQTNLEAFTSIGSKPNHNARKILALAESAPASYPATTKHIADRNSLLLYFEHYGAAEESDSVFFGPGNIALDQKGDLWIANNFKPGTENNDPPFPSVALPKMKPNGALSGGEPLQGGGIYGSGFGVAIDPSNQVWVGNFGFGSSKIPLRGNGNSVSLFSQQGEAGSPDGSPLPSRTPSGGYTQGDLLGVQGVVSDQRGNIWIASFRHTTKNPSKIVVYPQGDPNRFVSFEHPELTSPFDIAIDAEGEAWVSYKAGGRLGKGGVAQLSYDAADGIDAVKTIQSKQFNVPFGIATGSDGSVWVSNNGGSPRYASKTVSRIDALTGELQTFPLNSESFTGPWGINVDGSNNVYVANFEGLSFSVLCGATDGCPGGVPQGGALSPEGGYDFDGLIMRPTGLEVDSAGNLWVANNYHVDADDYGQHSVFQAIGLADPVTTPAIGPVNPLL